MLVKVNVPAPALVMPPVSLITPLKLVSAPNAWLTVSVPEPNKILASV